MTLKVYAHFVADLGRRGHGEFRGIVELGPDTALERAEQALALELARDLQIRVCDIRLLHWSRLH